MSGRVFLKLYAITLLILLAAGSTLFHFTEQHLRKGLEEDLKFSSNALMNQLGKQMELTFAEIRSDLVFLAMEQHVNQLYPSPDNQLSLEMVHKLWTDFAAHRKRYDQIRLLDVHGSELVRINYNNGEPSAVPEEKLQSKASRYYFTEAIILAPGSIYVSPLDLNVENRKIELPLKPMIRFATPIVNEGKETIGLMLVNYLAEGLLDAFILSSSSFPGKALLINNEGYPLISPDSSQAWNFMFPDSPQSNLRNSYPTIWQHLPESRGQYLTSQGLFTFDHIDPSGIAAKASCPSCLTLLLHIPEEQIVSILKRKVRAVLPPLLTVFLLLATIFGLLLWHWNRRRIQQSEIAALNDQITFERDLFVNGPSTIVKLRNEIGWPVDYCSANVRELLGYDADSFQTEKMTYASIIDPPYLPQYISETQNADQGLVQTFKRSPYRVVDRQGRRKWVQDVCRPMRDKFGKVSHYYAHISDISPLKEAERNLSLSHEYIQNVVDTLPDPTMVIDVSNYQLQLSNQSARSLYNGGHDIAPDTTCFRLTHKRDAPCTGLSEPCPIHEVILTGKPVSVRHKHYDHMGKLLYIDVRATPLFDASGKQIVQIVESHRDVTESVMMEKQLQHLANTDRLTQVYNRLKFDDELKSQISWAHATDNSLGLIMFDLDHFKQVNDNYGHDTGDLVLKNTVELVQKQIRRSDTLARWGGEEFMIITPLTDTFELKTIADALRTQIERLDNDKAGQVTASFGGSILRKEDSFATLIKRVDAALYQSKQNGRNCTTIVE